VRSRPRTGYVRAASPWLEDLLQPRSEKGGG
jgi:hypothetical protein